MSRGKRAALALACALFAEFIVASALALRGHSGLTGVLEVMVGLGIFVLAGWLLSLPIVLTFDRIDGWRIWVLAAFGLLIGPVAIIVLASVFNVAEGTKLRESLNAGTLVVALIATIIGSLSMAGYLAALKLLSRPERRPSL